MSKVFGKYLVSWENQNGTKNKYTLSGNDRHARIYLKPNAEDAFVNVAISAYGFKSEKITRNALIGFPGNSKIKILRAMAKLNGAAGARPALGDVALNASINFIANKDMAEIANFKFRLPEYDVWYNLNFEIPNAPYFRGIPIGGKFFFDETAINGVPYNYFSLDDFNIQDLYIGQNVFPNLILELESAGMQDKEGGIL